MALGILREARYQSKKARHTIWASVIVCALVTMGLFANVVIPRCEHKVNRNNNISTAEVNIETINSQLEQIKNYLLQIIDLNASITNNFNITPKVHINARNKKVSSKKKSSPIQAVLKVDTIICDGETYLVVPFPKSENQKN